MAAGFRSTLKRLVPVAARRRFRPAPKSWSEIVTPPERPVPLSAVHIYAVIGTWMEGDVVADTVANAFEQGCERVFVVDNESPDDTVERALAAGAELGMTYRTGQFECYYQICLMNELVQYVSRTSDYDHLWWLYLDADEFPRPTGGGTIRELLGRLDQQYRVVGARVINHYPTPGRTAYERGHHPIDAQPLCEEFVSDVCAAGHRKHPLLRWDRYGDRIDASPGFHRAEPGRVPWLEPIIDVAIHHFPFREELTARKRMELLWSESVGDSRAKADDPATDHMRARRDSLDAVYAGEWKAVANFMPGRPEWGVDPVHWRDLEPPLSDDVRRWRVRS